MKYDLITHKRTTEEAKTSYVNLGKRKLVDLLLGQINKFYVFWTVGVDFKYVVE